MPALRFDVHQGDQEETAYIGSAGWLAAYVALFNSRIFETLLGGIAPQVAGGQYDLSPRYVNSIPLPNLSEDALDPALGHVVRRLDRLGGDIHLEDPGWRDSVDELVAICYRTKPQLWLKP
jgi:adenine-specific DNA-methyltransferase